MIADYKSLLALVHEKLCGQIGDGKHNITVSLHILPDGFNYRCRVAGRTLVYKLTG